eukprot:c6183_g1_i1.p3 GENE.c6183_g1_i1~~c6183_g1_i1.p3  ORF type:complete len:157 (-),score=47.07 c6183_g1_i1:117-587(-)
MKQFIVVAPAVSVAKLWIELQGPDNSLVENSTSLMIVGTLGLISALLAVWGLFIIFSATHNILREYNTAWKFLAIKGILILTSSQELAIALFVRKDEIPPEDKFSTLFLVQFYVSFVACVEGFILTLSLIWAFPESEIAAIREKDSESSKLVINYA